jgi:Zn-dependent M28 family amino/carboxypeptidase
MFSWLMIFVTAAAFAYLIPWVILGQPSFRSSKKQEIAVNPDQLTVHVRVLAEDFFPRHGAHLGNINRTAEYLKAEFQKVGAGEVLENWFEMGNLRYRNVSLLLGDPKAERVVIGAHYDACGPQPGADDNASGVAGLIELAKLFGRNPLQNSAIELVGYPLEEPPWFGTEMMGSHHHAANLLRESVVCRYMICLEMIGYFSEQPESQKYPHPLLRFFYPNTGNFIMVVGNLEQRQLTRNFKVGMKGTTDLPVFSICGPAAIPGIDFSDHRNYWQMGIPALMITDTSFYRNLAYHTPADTPDRLDYQKMAQVVTGVFYAVKRLD